ncbi:MAG: hypothetical protein WCO67_02430 [Betaproteobacteria bacterium]
MNFKLKALAAAVAFVAASGANAAVTAPNVANGGSLVFQAWDATQAFIIDLGSVFNSVYGSAAAVTTQAAGDVTYNLGSLFTSTFGSNSGVNWSVLSDKSLNDGTSKVGILATSGIASGYSSFNTSAGTTLASATNNSYSNIAANVPGVSGLVNNVNPAYTPTNFNSATYNSLSGAIGGIARTGYFSGPIDASTSYAAGTGVAYFTSVINGSTATAQTAKTAFAGANGAANFILQSDGTLTYHVAGAPAAVPLPAALWLFASGLLGLVGIGRRKLNALA